MSFSQPAIDYACRDADTALRLYHVFKPRLEAEGLWEPYQTVLDTLPLILTMQATGWRIDTLYLHRLIGIFDREQAHVEADIAEMGFPGLNANSYLQVGHALYGELEIEPRAYTKKTRNPATGNKYLKAIELEHPLVRKIVDVRELVTLKGIIRDTLDNTDSAGYLYPRLNVCGTPTGRLACNDPNLLAIPKRSDRGKLIRKGFLPPDGMELWSWDLSQIELRVLAIGSEDPELVRAFNAGEDIHEATARRMFGDAYKPENRFAAKSVNFGIPMGISYKGLTQQIHKEGILGHTDKDSKEWLKGWHQAYPVASRWLDRCIDEARHTGWVCCLGGRRRYLPGVSAASRGVRARAERQVQSFPMQAGAQYLMHRWEKAVYDMVVETGLGVPILQIHDDLVLAGDPKDYETVDGIMRGLLPTHYNVPIISGDDTRGGDMGRLRVITRPTASIKILRDKGVSGSTDHELKQTLDYISELESRLDQLAGAGREVPPPRPQ